ncbi:alpha/beta hydrolase [soil metagenome]
MLGALSATAALTALGCSGDDERPASGPGEGGQAEPPDPEVIAYGKEPLQQGAISRPDNEDRDPTPVVVLVHGGFWQSGFDRSLMDPLVPSLLAEGWAAWNIDYRPVGDGGGWPATFTDVADAVDLLDRMAPELLFDLDRVAMVGHSAGGTLALWSAARSGLPAEVPGADPAVSPSTVVSQAGVTNLAAAAIDDLGRGAAAQLMGGLPTGEGGGDYLYASPIERLPLGPAVRQLLVHGSDDAIVPPAQSETYAARADDAGDEVTLEVTPGDHFSVIDPDGESWAQVLAFLSDRFA